MMDAPLSGVTVVALEQVVAAPMCTRTLADLGARVIKVENPDGGDFARHFDDVLHRLLARADVLVSNLAPGALARLGLGPADVAVRHPHLIPVTIDGYGPGG